MERSSLLSSRSLDWDKCALCQSVSAESLLHPINSKSMKPEDCYEKLEAAINDFKLTGFESLPIKVDVSLLDEGRGIKETLFQHQAKWHKSCRLKLHPKVAVSLRKKARMDPGTALPPNSDNEDSTSRKYLRNRRASSSRSVVCFFCNEPESSEQSLHRAQTLGLNDKVKECANQLVDEILLAKLSKGDMVAQDAMYHKLCLTKLYNKCRESVPSDPQKTTDSELEAIVLAELISYLHESRSSTGTTVFKLSELVKMYADRLAQVGVSVNSRVHSTKLKDRILFQVKDLKSFSKGRESYLAFDDDVDNAICTAYQNTFDNDAIILSKAASIIRKDILKHEISFAYEFTEKSQDDSTPSSIKSFLSMLLYGTHIKDRSYTYVPTQPILTISQILVFNCKTARGKPETIYHKRSREPPLPVGLGLYLHSHARKRQIVDMMFDLGLSVSYDRVLEVSSCIAESLCQEYENKNIVCPPNLVKGEFTVAAGDNIDHNPSASTAKSSFHGTSISIFQHPTVESGTKPWLDFQIPSKPTTKGIPSLPDFYTTVQPCAIFRQQLTVPIVQGPHASDLSTLVTAKKEEEEWMNNVNRQVRVENTNNEPVSWSAYHAKNKPIKVPCIGALLPLLKQPPNSSAVIAHVLTIVSKAFSILCPDQAPVITFDQPLFALARQLQWNQPSLFGEDKFVIMLGGLHIEQAFLKLIGRWLEGSGWTQLIVDAQLATSGTAEAFLDASHITKTRRVHQITACALNVMLHEAYTEATEISGTEITISEWCNIRRKQSPLFQYWYTTLHLQLLLNMFVRSLRSGDFQLYCDCLTQMCPWFFAMDRINYARWLPVHLRDMVTLKHTHPAIATQFSKGNFVIYKTSHRFSAIPIDQAHEQYNAIVKGDGGAIGLTENPSALRRWSVCGPEVARLVSQFQEMINHSSYSSHLHHDENFSVQQHFMEDVKKVLNTFQDLGNPYNDESEDLINIVTKQIADDRVKKTVMQIEDVGVTHFQQYMNNRIKEPKEPVLQPLKKLKLSLMSTPPKLKSTLSSIRNDVKLFSRLYIGCEARGGDLDEFFRHENHAWPPSLAEYGQLRHTKKSDIIGCVEQLVPEHGRPNEINIVILDGAVIVHFIRPTEAMKNFQDYADRGVIPYVKAQFRTASRVDIIWDSYRIDSLKRATRLRRGVGIRTRVTPSTPLPRKWDEFLRSSRNKEELFSFLSSCVTNISPDNGTVITTMGEDVVCNADISVASLCPSNHEEADTRLILHAYSAFQCGFSKIIIKTVDSDVVVLSIAFTAQHPGVQVWVELGMGKSNRIISAHDVAAALQYEKACALTTFHSITGCDTVSGFSTRGKKSAWKAWLRYPDVTAAFLSLSRPCSEVTHEILNHIQRFVIVMYDTASSDTDVDVARRRLFTQKVKTLESIPPTKDALLQHVKRAAYQSGHIWGQACVKMQDLPSPENWGWMKGESGWEPTWITLPEASAACIESLSCRCSNKKCSNHCKCVSYEIQCTALCKCEGNCEN